MKLMPAVVLLICAASSRAAPANKEIDAFEPEAGLQAFTAATGRPLAQSDSAAKLQVGQCTWFVHSVCPFELPVQGMAGTYVEGARNLGLTVGQEPVVGSVAVWSEEVAGTGHVAYVTAVGVEPGTFDVWDANWPNDGRVRHRRHASGDGNILGFILPPAESVPSPEPIQAGGPAPIDWSQPLGEPQKFAGDRVLFSAGGLVATTEGVALLGERVTVYTAVGEKVFGPVDGWGEAFSPTDELFAYGIGKLGQYTTILVRLSDGETVSSVTGNEATFSPDGQWLAAVEGTPLGGQTTHVYRVSDPTAVQTILGGKPTWSPDGRFLATSSNGATRLWSLP